MYLQTPEDVEFLNLVYEKTDLSAKNIDLIGIDPKDGNDCLQGQMKATEGDLWNDQRSYLNKSIFDDVGDFVDIPHISHISRANGTVLDSTHQAYESYIAKETYFMGTEFCVNYSLEEMYTQLYRLAKGQALTNMQQLKAMHGILDYPSIEHNRTIQLRRLKSLRDNAIGRGETVENGKILSKEQLEKRSEGFTREAIKRGEIVDQGRIKSRTSIEKASITKTEQGFHVFKLDFNENREIFLGFFASPTVLFNSDVAKRIFQYHHICADKDGEWSRKRSSPLTFPVDDPSQRINKKFKQNCQIGKDQRPFIDVYCETTKEMIRIERIPREDKDWSNCSTSDQQHGVGKSIAPIRKPPIRNPPRQKKKKTASANAKATKTPANTKEKATTSSSVSATRNKRKSSSSSGNTPLRKKTISLFLTVTMNVNQKKWRNEREMEI